MNMKFSAWWGKARERFHRMSTREQMLSILVTFGVFYFVFDGMVFVNQSTRMAALEQQRSQLTAKLAAMELEIQTTGKRAQDLKLKEEVESTHSKLSREVGVLNRQLATIQSDAVSAGDVVMGLLGANHPGVTVVNLRLIEPKVLLNGVDGKAGPSSSRSAVKQSTGKNSKNGDLTEEKAMGTVYKHSIDVDLRGTYPDLMSFVKDLEETAPNMIWSNVAVRVTKYPVSTLRMTLSMLSNQEGAGLR